MKGSKKDKKYLISVLLVVVLFAAVLIALCSGRYFVSPDKVVGILLAPALGMPGDVTPIDISVVQNVRIPRIVLAVFVGAGLAVAGAALQGLFSNPLASPDTLGVANGAAFGAALSMLFTETMLIIQVSALIFGMVAIMCTYMISLVRGKSNVLMVVLAGVVVSSFFVALISLVKYVADTETKLPSITYWLMGSMAGISYKTLMTGIPLMLAGIAIIFLLRWRINILTLSEEEAKAMGIQVKQIRWTVILAATTVTAAAVSMCGQVGWVGLLVPHISRMVVGSNYKYVIPFSIGTGAIFMVIVDTLARSAIAAEIPLSILTAIIGAPFFAYLLRKTGGGWT